MDTIKKNDLEVFNILPGYFFSFSSNGFITRINDLFLDRLGYDAEEIINVKKPTELLTTGSKIFFQTHFYPLIKLQGKLDEIFLSFHTKNGEDVPVLLNVLLVEDADQFEVHCAGMQISNRSRFEEEILQAKRLAEKAVLENDELIRVKNDLNENQRTLELRLQRLAQQNMEQQQINMVISHDLQEPLRKVCIFTNKILKEASATMDQRIFKDLEKVNTAAEKMRTLVISLQQYLSYDIRRPLFANYDLNSILVIAKERAGMFPSDPSLKFIQNNLSEIFGDRELLISLFTHLLSNSLKFRDKNKAFLEVKVTTDFIKQNIFKETENKYEYENFFRITYTDNAIGFEQKYASGIFDLFRKLDDTQEGLGLGLAYCKKILDLHHGFIGTRSTAGEGTSFTILLPTPLP